MQRASSVVAARTAAAAVAFPAAAPLRALPFAALPPPRRAFSSLPNGPSSSAASVSSASAAASSSFVRRHPKKLAALAVTGGAVAYFASAARSGKQPAVPLKSFDINDYKGMGSLEAFKKQQDIVLYQYETCPFCNKVRAYLDYNGIAYRKVEVNPMHKKQLKQGPQPELASCGTVPVLVINGHVLIDSTPIIKNINEIMNLYRPQGQQQPLSEDDIAGLEFVDTRFIRLTAPNLYRSFGDSVAAFEYIASNSQMASESAVTRGATKYVGAVMMYLITKYKLNKKYNIVDPRKMLYDACAEWMTQLRGQPFRGGQQPSVPDVAAYGVLRALRGYRTFDDIQANVDPKFMQWFNEMDRRVNAAAIQA